MELLVHLGDLLRGRVAVHLIDDLGEVSRAVQLAVSECLLIALDDLLDTIDTWIEDITIECEAVRASIIIRWDRTAKSIQVDHLVTVVELEDVANGLNRLQVLVPLRVEEVE